MLLTRPQEPPGFPTPPPGVVELSSGALLAATTTPSTMHLYASRSVSGVTTGATSSSSSCPGNVCRLSSCSSSSHHHQVSSPPPVLVNHGLLPPVATGFRVHSTEVSPPTQECKEEVKMETSQQPETAATTHPLASSSSSPSPSPALPVTIYSNNNNNSVKAAKRASLRTPLDIGRVHIPTVQIINDPVTGRVSHAVYDIYVQPAGRSDDWVIHRRYRNFVELCKSFPPEVSERVPKLPPKTVFVNTSKAFVEKRRLALVKWLEDVLAVAELRRTKALRDFLGMPDHRWAPTCGATSSTASLDGLLGGLAGGQSSSSSSSMGLTHFQFLNTAHKSEGRTVDFWKALSSSSSSTPAGRKQQQMVRMQGSAAGAPPAATPRRAASVGSALSSEVEVARDLLLMGAALQQQKQQQQQQQGAARKEVEGGEEEQHKGMLPPRMNCVGMEEGHQFLNVSCTGAVGPGGPGGCSVM